MADATARSMVSQLAVTVGGLKALSALVQAMVASSPDDAVQRQPADPSKHGSSNVGVAHSAKAMTEKQTARARSRLHLEGSAERLKWFDEQPAKCPLPRLPSLPPGLGYKSRAQPSEAATIKRLPTRDASGPHPPSLPPGLGLSSRAQPKQQPATQSLKLQNALTRQAHAASVWTSVGSQEKYSRPGSGLLRSPLAGANSSASQMLSPSDATGTNATAGAPPRLKKHSLVYFERRRAQQAGLRRIAYSLPKWCVVAKLTDGDKSIHGGGQVRLWLALSFAYTLRRRAEQSPRAVQRRTTSKQQAQRSCYVIMFACRLRCRAKRSQTAVLRHALAKQRAHVLATIARPPTPLVDWDVGYDVTTAAFTYRDANGAIHHQHPAATGRTVIPAYSHDGSVVQPMMPPRCSAVVLCPEASGAWCYYDTALGHTYWHHPDGSTPMQSRLVCSAYGRVPLDPPPPPPWMSLGNLRNSDWMAVHDAADADHHVHQTLLFNTVTGAMREAPWILLRTPDGCKYFANLFTKQTRWLPPHRWMEGWISRRPVTAEEFCNDVYPLTFAEIAERPRKPDRPHDSRAPLLGLMCRQRVDGGAPYLYESGKPQYEPDEFDTPLTYPLVGYVKVGERWVALSTVPAEQEALAARRDKLEAELARLLASFKSGVELGIQPHVRSVVRAEELRLDAKRATEFAASPPAIPALARSLSGAPAVAEHASATIDLRLGLPGIADILDSETAALIATADHHAYGRSTSSGDDVRDSKSSVPLDAANTVSTSAYGKPLSTQPKRMRSIHVVAKIFSLDSERDHPKDLATWGQCKTAATDVKTSSPYYVGVNPTSTDYTIA